MACQLRKLYMEPGIGTRLGQSTHGTWIAGETMENKDASWARAVMRERFGSRNSWCSHEVPPQYLHCVQTLVTSVGPRPRGSLTPCAVTGGLEN